MMSVPVNRKIATVVFIDPFTSGKPYKSVSILKNTLNPALRKAVIDIEVFKPYFGVSEDGVKLKGVNLKGVNQNNEDNAEAR